MSKTAQVFRLIGLIILIIFFFPVLVIFDAMKRAN